jgi:hypothetical protein
MLWCVSVGESTLDRVIYHCHKVLDLAAFVSSYPEMESPEREIALAYNVLPVDRHSCYKPHLYPATRQFNTDAAHTSVLLPSKVVAIDLWGIVLWAESLNGCRGRLVGSRGGGWDGLRARFYRQGKSEQIVLVRTGRLLVHHYAR